MRRRLRSWRSEIWCSCFPQNAHSFTRIMTQKGLRNSFPGPLFYVQKFIANPHTPSHPFPHKGNPATQHFQPNNPLNQPKQPQFPSNSPHNFLPIPPSELGLNRALPECSSGNNPHGNPAENPLYPGFPEGNGGRSWRGLVEWKVGSKNSLKSAGERVGRGDLEWSK